MKKLFFVLLLSLCYILYTDQIIFGVVVALLYFFSATILKVSSYKRLCTFNLFSVFYVVYGFLVLLSHIELIKDPFEDFYVHNDAAWSFYSSIMKQVLPCGWGELSERTLLNPYFGLYPLAAFIMGAWGKLGQELGIENLRLFLRILPFFTGATIIALMTNILEGKGKGKSEILKYIIPFGLFSYLFITSAIFSRDCFVCLAYTLGAVVYLKDDVKYRLGWFIVLAFISAGFRPHNGLLFLVYPFAYYYGYLKNKIGSISIILIIGIAIFAYSYLEGMVSNVSEVMDGYDKGALSNNGGLFVTFYALPFPINTLVMMVYMTLEPLPILFYINGDGGTWLNLPNILSPYLMSMCFLVCLYAIKNIPNIYKIKSLIIISILAYGGIIYGSPDLRRAFAAIPSLYLCYCLVEKDCPSAFKQKIKKNVWTAITIINIFFIYYVYLR